VTETTGSATATFPAELELGGWRVHPSLNRLTRDGVTIRIEPKLMDVLLLLARHAGQVVSKDDIADAVWPRTFLSESVITRAIAGLRRALEDDVRAPRFIETIAKRGYRLLMPAVVVTAQEPFDRAPVPFSSSSSLPKPTLDRSAPSASALPGASARPSSPYVVGQWVRGERFYGRGPEIAEILDGPRNGVWVLGARAVGKTSLLKQLEHLTAAEPEGRYFPLFWDLQGSVDPGALARDFHAALADAEERLGALDISLAEVEGEDLFAALGRLRRAVRARGRTLLLLWDEVEELIHLHAEDPTILRKLRRTLQSQEGIRTVMASGPRLWKLAEQRDDTSPFLHGFAPPLYLGPLADEAALGLVRRTQGGSERSGAREAGSAIDEAAVEELLRRSGNHPSVLQLLCARTIELGDLERATESVASDPTVQLFFAVDFDLLAPLEREIVLALARGEAESAEEGEPAPLDGNGRTARPAETRAARLHLERLGVLRRTKGEGLELASPLFRRWLRERPAAPAPLSE
jgi:DNA-binding winged helix-turn-helix (wHTH) protein